MASELIPFAPGERSASVALLADLGKTWTVNGKGYILVRNSAAAVAAPQSMNFISALAATAVNFIVAITATNNSPQCLGLADLNQAALAASDFFLLQFAGNANYISDAAVAAGALIGSGAVTAGRTTSTTITAGVGAIGVSTSAPGAAAVASFAWLKGNIA